MAFIGIDVEKERKGRSVEDFVRDSWRDLIQRNMETTFHVLIEACGRQPNLSKLMPFTSMNRLFFSRTTEYPFEQVELGACTTDATGLFIAYLDKKESDPLTAMECAQLLENSLPANLGWARFGSAEDKPGSPKG